MAKKKLLLLPLIVTLTLLFAVSMITSACSCGVQGGMENESPVIVDLTASPSTITTSSPGAVSVNATGYEGNTSELEYEWSISGGTINNANQNATTFTAPDNPGTITIGVTISDSSGVIVAEGSIQVTVEEAANANADDVEAQDNENEEVAVALILPTTTVITGSPGIVTANVTGYSNDMSGLTYSWSIKGGGTINNANQNATTFTAPDNPGTITIGVTISDSSGVIVAEASIQVTVTPATQQSQDTPSEGVIASDIQEN